MGLLGTHSKKKNNKDQIKEIREKIAILEASGMKESAARLTAQLARLEGTQGDEVKERYHPAKVKKQIKEARAMGLAK
jgi:hypothetical protein